MKKNNSFYKYTSLKNFEHLLDMLLKERLYSAKYSELNDPMEGVIKVDNTIPSTRESEWENIIQDLRICCFTKHPDDPLMWAHYADGGKGCLVEFELLDEQKYFKVSYSKKPIVSEEDLNKEKAIEILTFKPECWKYEAEYRCIQSEKFLHVRIKKITFGSRSNDQSINMLMHILTLCKPELKVYKIGQTGVFKKPSILTGAKRTYVKTSNPNECAKCIAREIIERNFTHFPTN